VALVTVSLSPQARTGKADASGRCVLTVEPPSLIYDAARVLRMTVTAPDVAPIPYAFAYAGDERAENLIDATSDARTDIADEASPPVLPFGVNLLVVFGSVAPGGQCTLRADLEYLRDDSGGWS
jgi:hypothetical protein